MDNGSASDVNSTPISGYRKPRTAPRSKPVSRQNRPRSAVTSGRALFVNGDPNSAWSRRFHDLVVGHVSDLGDVTILSDAQISLVRRAAAIECELERLDAMLSRGEFVDMDAYARVSGHLRRLFETLGLERRNIKDVTPRGSPMRQHLEHRLAEAATTIDAEPLP
jgi:hypothetical protein